MTNLDEILLIYYKKDKLKIPTNGPGAVVYNISENWKKMNVKFSEFPINPSNIFDIINVVKKVLFSKNKIINVHQSGNKIPLIILLLSKINRKNSYYFTTHGSEYLQNLNQGRQQSKRKVIMEKLLLENFDNIICVSELQMIDLQKNFNINNNIYYINNGFNSKYKNYIALRENKDDKIVFLLAGGIKKNKGIFESLKVIKFIKDNINNKKIIFNIIGDYIEEDYVLFNEYVKENNLENNVNYLGFIEDRLKVYNLYLESNFVVSLSYYDTFNVSVVEGLSLGKPVIVSNSTGASKFIKDFENGIVLDLKKIELEKILKYVKEDREDVISHRIEICKNSVADLTWENTAKNYFKLLTK